MRRAEIRRQRTQTIRPAYRQPASESGGDNPLDWDFAAEASDRKWVADITFVAPMKDISARMAAVLDCFSRRIVGWSMADHMKVDLVSDVLQMGGWSSGDGGELDCCITAIAAASLRQRRLSASAVESRNRSQHEPPGRLLRQCDDGKLLGHAQERAGASTALRNRTQAKASIFEYIEVLLQSQTTAQLHFATPACEMFEAA